MRAHRNNALIRLPTAKNSGTVSFFPSHHSMVALPLCAFKDTAVSVAYGGWYEPPALNLGTVSGFALLALELFDLALSQKDQHLPFAGHVVCIVKHLYVV